MIKLRAASNISADYPHLNVIGVYKTIGKKAKIKQILISLLLKNMFPYLFKSDPI